MSTVFTPYPLVAALHESEEFLGAQRRWQSINRKQGHFLDKFFAPCHEELSHLPELESIASYKAEAINQFLRQHNFDVQLQPFALGDFGAASVLDVSVAWQKAGKKTRLRTPNLQMYPAIYLAGRGVQFLPLTYHREPLVRLATKSEDVVYLMMFDGYPSEFELMSTIQRLMREAREVNKRAAHKGVIFPMVNLDLETDSQWLVGLHTTAKDGAPAIISQAWQQSIFKMNQYGARAKSGAAIRVTRGGAKPYIINRPFLLWIERPGLSTPLFAAHITPENWQDPGALSEM